MSITVNQGTQTAVSADTIGTVQFPIVKLDIGAAGLSSAFTGTLPEITNITKGTLSSVAAGTLNQLGTLTAGTVDSVSQLPLNNWATVINVGTNLFGTIKPAVSGSSIFVTDLTINLGVVGGTVAIYSGSTGSPIAGTWIFTANGGIVQNYRTPLFTVAGSALTYQQQGTSSLSIDVQGFVR